MTSRANIKIFKIEFICCEIEADSMKEFEVFLYKEWNINSLQKITSEGFNFSQENDKLRRKSESDFNIANFLKSMHDYKTKEKSKNI